MGLAVQTDRVTQLADTLRDYQREAAKAVFSAWPKMQRVLVSLPVGGGKTHVGMYVAGAWEQSIHKDYGLPPTVLWLAPLDELVWQAVDECRDLLGIEPDVEKADRTAHKEVALGRSRIVVGSVQTLMRDSRRMAYAHDSFGSVIVDEAHHGPAMHFQEVIGYFHPSRLLGLTATCQRGDQVSLGKVFDDVVAHYELFHAIKDGWLCNLIHRQIKVDGLDFSRIGTDASGDLSATDIERVITEERPLHALVAPVVQEAGDRQTIMFLPTVASAEMAAALLESRYTTRGVVLVTGKTPEDERRELVARYKNGDAQWFVNVGVAVEGFNAPATSCIAVLRPTKSWTRAMQMIGRGLRGGWRCPVGDKKDCLLLDLTGTMGKHKLVSAADLLGGIYDKEVVEKAREWCGEKNADGEAAGVMAELEKAAGMADEIKAESRRKILAEARLNRKTINPFDLLDVPDRQEPGWWEAKEPTPDQIARLSAAGIKTDGCFDQAQARRLLRELDARRDAGLCTFKQARLLANFGYEPNVTFEEAGHIIDSMKGSDGKIHRDRKDVIRWAQQKAKRSEDALVSECDRAEVVRGKRGGFRCLRCRVGEKNVDIRDRIKARRVWSRLTAKGVKPSDPNKVSR